MDIIDALKHAENALRDTITYILKEKYGDNWPNESGLSNDRINAWKSKKEIEEKKLGRSDPRIIYYADFYDLKSIITKKWDIGFSAVFKKQKEFVSLLEILEDLRNPDAHRRELLPHEKHLAIGISGKIRNQISEYFSNMKTKESYYPRIECVQDSFGNAWAIGEATPKDTKLTLREGDTIEFSVVANDPLNEELEYVVAACSSPRKVEWKKTGDSIITLDESHVGNKLWIHIAVKSSRKYHASSDAIVGKIDDLVQFGYEVLPPIPHI